MIYAIILQITKKEDDFRNNFTNHKKKYKITKKMTISAIILQKKTISAVPLRFFSLKTIVTDLLGGIAGVGYA